MARLLTRLLLSVCVWGGGYSCVCVCVRVEGVEWEVTYRRAVSNSLPSVKYASNRSKLYKTQNVTHIIHHRSR